ncbi:MAG: hypothetical protein J7484_10725 [Microbacterium sp.]|nr:hypothetical protein [Microbacterium sp.]
MTDQRPQYGELATPEEQRQAAGLPPIAEVVPEPVPESPATPAVAAPARPRPADRLVTIALLAYGLVNVVITGMSYLDIAPVMDQAMKILGIDGTFTNFAQGKLWGTVAAIVLAVGWCVTAVLALRRLRTGKLTWWVPVVGAVVTSLVVSGLIAIPMMGDPAFAGYLGGAGR